MVRTLLLIPTELEYKHIPPSVISNLASIDGRVELCGFGPIVSAIRTTRLLAKHQPEQVILCGVAGAMDLRLNVGEAYRFSTVACYGVGAGSGDQYQTAAEMGWRQSRLGDEEIATPAVTDTIALAHAAFAEEPHLLLTVCAASSSRDDVERKRFKFPNASAEDMEGYSVALACQMAATPLQIMRGISNIAGDRNHQNWKIEQAVRAAATLVQENLFP
jgi:futalosine hydrolase